MTADNKPATLINDQTHLTLAIHSWQMYLEDQGSSIHTVKAFIGDLNLLADYLPPDQKIGGITTRELNNFLEWMVNKRGVPCSPKTLSRRITSLKAFFRWLAQYGAILVDPAEKVVQKSVRSPLPAVMSPEEMQAALAELATARRGSERLEQHIRNLYTTTCDQCGETVDAQAFFWQRDALTPYGAKAGNLIEAAQFVISRDT